MGENILTQYISIRDSNHLTLPNGVQMDLLGMNGWRGGEG